MKKLSNEKFVNGAPEQVVANERKKQADAEVKIAAIEAQLKGLWLFTEINYSERGYPTLNSPFI